MNPTKPQLYPETLVPALVAIPWAGHKSNREPESRGPDNFPIYADDPLRSFHLLLNDYISAARKRESWLTNPMTLPPGARLMAGTPRERSQTILSAAARVLWHCKTPRWNENGQEWVYEEARNNGLRQLMSALFQADFELTTGETIELAKILGGPMPHEMGNQIPSLGVVMAVEKAFAQKIFRLEHQEPLAKLLRSIITKTQCPKEAAEWARRLRLNGHYDPMDDPNQAFQRLAELILDEATLLELLEEMQMPLNQQWFHFCKGAPLNWFLDLLDSYATKQALSDEIRGGLLEIQKNLESVRLPPYLERMLTRIRDLLGPGAPEIEPGEAWSNRACADLRSLAPSAREGWDRLVVHCAAADSSKPTKKWLTCAGELVATLGKDTFKKTVLEWFPLVAKPRPVHRAPRQPQWEPDPDLLITDRNATILKGLVWCCAGMVDVEISRTLSELAEVCFKKVRWLGPRCPRVGNACLYSLSSTASEESAAELSKLDQVVKQPTAKKRIGKSLDKAAEITGQSRADLEEKSVPNFGLNVEGKLTRQMGRHTVELLVVDSREIRIQWSETGGKQLKSVPAQVKRDHAAELKQFQKLIKEIEKMLVAQRIRVERLLMSGREWNLESWRQRYWDHPLLANISRRLIWHFRLGDRTALGAYHNGKLADVKDKSLDWLAPESHVRLWHPIGFPPETVAAWREWLQTHEVCQPFKQAHREVYLLTDAELNTANYSNRFAAHILGQHQFAALCAQRGWKYSFMGGFDSQSTPRLELPQWNMVAEFWVEPAGELAHSGVSMYLTTDQVRFVRGEEPLSLADVPANVFTEVMRDVDLFVGVGSIGSDPAWQDHGEVQGAGEYWRNFSFGDLNSLAKTRKEVLERLLPKLKIAGQCSFDNKSLVVRGSLRTYRIHLGSGNIQMEPNNQYLCIVPQQSPETRSASKIFLPFEGDRTLSVILSKAFLLAEDSRIKDQSILSQIRR
jgi:hypothetical protein